VNIRCAPPLIAGRRTGARALESVRHGCELSED
jgi:hypothetical protein